MNNSKVIRFPPKFALFETKVQDNDMEQMTLIMQINIAHNLYIKFILLYDKL